MQEEISTLIMRSLVVFPNQEVKVDIKSDISKNIIFEASKDNNGLILVGIIDEDTDGICNTGVVAKIKSKLELPNNTLRVTLRGLRRVNINKYFNKNSEVLYALITDINSNNYDLSEGDALKRKLVSLLKELIDLSFDLSNSIISSLDNSDDLNTITDMICSFLPFDINKRLLYLKEIDPVVRAHNLIVDIQKEIEVLKLEEKIDERVSDAIDNGQKEFILREKLKEIKNELGEKSLKDEDVLNFNNILDSLELNSKTYKKIQDEIQKYEIASDTSPETNILRTYIDTVLSLPWNTSTTEVTDADKIHKSLDKTHYGLMDIKQRVLEYAGIKSLNPDINNPIICLVGPPGVGKTTIASSIAKALNREFIKISVGGLNDSLELVGSRRTYLGASPGKIMQSIKKCGSNNPVILVDEVDKMVKDYKGDPAATLLEILDPNQNKNFVDNYIEEPFDLSNVFFILTANIESDIPSTLLDRLEIIHLNSYTDYEKLSIVKKYLLPKIFDDYGIEKIKISDDVLKQIINNYTYESGVRDLDRVLKKYVRRVVLNNLEQDSLEEILGKPKYVRECISDIVEPGVSNALAYTPMGGMVTKIETVKMHGNGNVIITGMPGKTLEESVTVAMDFLKTNYNLNINSSDIHIHFLDATIQKDGPSAGAAIAIALMSLYLDKAISGKIAFTGEISLKGNILKVGGIKEKIIGACNAGIDTIYIPMENMSDIDSIPKKIIKDIDIIGVTTYNEIYKAVFNL